MVLATLRGVTVGLLTHPIRTINQLDAGLLIGMELVDEWAREDAQRIRAAFGRQKRVHDSAGTPVAR